MSAARHRPACPRRCCGIASAVWLLSLLCLPGPSAAQAQVDDAPKTKAEKKKSAFSAHLRAAGDFHRRRLVESMEIRIEEIDRAASLDEEQGKKLRIAAKGATGRVIDEWLEMMMQNSELEIHFGQIDGEQAIATLIGWGAGLDVEEVVGQEIWKTAVSRQLSVAQKALHGALLAERQAFARGVSIQQLVLTLDRQLRLSTEQRAAMSKLFDEKFPKEFEFAGDLALTGGAVGFDRQGGPVDPFAPDTADPLKEISDGRLSEILNKTQLSRWTAFRQELSGALADGFGHGAWIPQNGGFFNLDDGNGGGRVLRFNGRAMVE